MKYLRMKTMLAATMVMLFSFGCAQSNGQKGQDHQKQGPPSFEHLLEKMDANSDGLLSAEEVDGPLAEHFEKIDLDQNGYINEEEFDAAPKPEGPPKGK